MYVEPRKMVQMNRVAGQKLRDRCREQMYGHQGGKTVVGWGWWCAELGDWDWHVYSDVYKIDDWLILKKSDTYKFIWCTVKAKGNMRGLIDDKALIVCGYERLSMEQ